MNHVLIVGGAGFIGQMLVRSFVESGWRVTVFDIKTGIFDHDSVRYFALDVVSGKLPTLPSCNAIINLAGVTINHRFTPEYKKLVWSSRVISTRSLRQWVETQSWQPDIYIGASAIGYYGDRGNELLSVNTKPSEDTLSRVCIDWEREHAAFGKIGIPYAILRQGHVLGHAGFVAELLPWYQRGVRLILGSGDQYISWIDVRDLVRVYMLLATGTIEPGIYNAVAPSSVRFNDFAKQLGSVSRGVFPVHIPVWLLRIRLGELADLMVASQRVQYSEQLRSHFNYTDLTQTLEYCVWK